MVEKVIYLDWNIFQDIKQKRSCEGLIENLSAAKRKKYIVPYSPAHLRDLSRCKKEEYIKEDLKFISFLTDNYCIDRKDIDILIKCVKYPPELIFDEVKRNNNPAENPVILITEYKVDTSQLSAENIILPYLLQNNSIMSTQLINKFYDDFANSVTDKYSLHRDFRKSLKEIVALNNPAIKCFLEMPFYKYLLSDREEIKNNFKEIIESFLKLTNKTIDNISLGEKITTCYNILDFFPAFSEKIEKRNNINNIMTDADHVFYASGATYLIGSDDNMIEKSKFIYSFFNIKTKVLHKQKFIQSINFI